MDIQRLRDGTVLVDLGAVDWTDAVPRMADAWPVIANVAAEFLKAHPAWEWDRLRAYARFENGLIWFSPDPPLPRRNANVAGVKLACVANLYRALPDAEVQPDAFERAHESLAQRTSDVLRQSALMPPARASLAALQCLRLHALTIVSYDDLETERILVESAALITVGER